MKMQSPLFAKLETSEVENLVKEVKETVATDQLTTNKKPIMTTADFWNIQRLARPRVTRRFLV